MNRANRREGGTTRRYLHAAALVITFFSMGLSAETAAAHQVYVFAAPVGMRIEGRAYFRGGSPCKHCPVRVITEDQSEPVVIETDEQGNFSYEMPKPQDVRIVVDAGEGHTAEYTITAEEFGTEAGDIQTAAAESESALPKEGPPQGDKVASAAVETSGEHEPGAESDAAVQVAALRTQIIRLREDVQALRERLWLRDILGGIGFILGLTGVAYYFAMRKQSVGASETRHPTSEEDGDLA
ncbi:hypothetical protein [Thermostilla marina]